MYKPTYTKLAVPPGVARAKVTSGENRDFFDFVLPHSINKKAKLLYKKNLKQTKGIRNFLKKKMLGMNEVLFITHDFA